MERKLDFSGPEHFGLDVKDSTVVKPFGAIAPSWYFGRALAGVVAAGIGTTAPESNSTFFSIGSSGERILSLTAATLPSGSIHLSKEQSPKFGSFALNRSGDHLDRGTRKLQACGHLHAMLFEIGLAPCSSLGLQLTACRFSRPISIRSLAPQSPPNALRRSVLIQTGPAAT